MTDKPHMTLPNGDRIYEGGYGRTRDGQKVGPIRSTEWRNLFGVHGGSGLWNPDGTAHYPSKTDSPTIIAAWVDEPAELPYGHARLPSGKVVDLTNPHCTVFAMLDQVYGEGTQKAMREHGGEYEFVNSGADRWENISDPRWARVTTYRVKPKPPAPVVGEVTMTGFIGRKGPTFSTTPCSIDTHRLTLPTLDGKLVPGDYIGTDGHKIVVEKL